ncbi:MAG: gloA [Betaproteobacteria bacterium]|nr:gloA [Betaproteobacteria bacterium]
MIDHTGISVSDFVPSREFYRQALAPIGYTLLLEIPATVTGKTDVAGFGEPPKPDFRIGRGQPNRPPLHVAFRVGTRKLVDDFYWAALAAGGRDKGAPGIRAH